MKKGMTKGGNEAGGGCICICMYVWGGLCEVIALHCLLAFLA